MQDIWNEVCVFSPSLICLNMCSLEDQIRILENSRVRMLHLDIIDGHFSPSMPLGLETVRQLRKITNMSFDCHVMTTEQDYFINELLDIGVEQIVFHAETQPHIDRTLNRIHADGVRAGIALKPATPLSVLDYVLEKCDSVLLMLINPGYASVKEEKQVTYAECKIKKLRKMIDSRNCKTKIELDGRISIENIRKFGAKDADIFVMGSTCLDRRNLKKSLDELNAVRKEVLKQYENVFAGI